MLATRLPATAAVSRKDVPDPGWALQSNQPARFDQSLVPPHLLEKPPLQRACGVEFLVPQAAAPRGTTGPPRQSDC